MGFRRERIKDYFLLDTGVENIFINEYMAGAPGDFIKVYLFALMYAELGVDITNEDIAKQLSVEHEDVLKAWNHWERMGAIRKIKKETGNKFDYDVEFVVLKEQLYGEKNMKPALVSDQNIQSFMSDKNIQDMFSEIERITGRIVGATEMKEVLSWMTDFNASPEIIVYGYSYCIRKKKKHLKYIEAVVKNWAAEGLRDTVGVEKYLSKTEKRQHLYSRVFQALGFSRHATEEERRIMDTWFEDMEFSLEKVLSACSKTSGISNPNINYVNKVLVNWYDEEHSGKTGGEKGLTTGDIMKYYELLRKQEEEEAENHRKEVYEAVPHIREIEDEITKRSAELSKVIISGRIDREKVMSEIKHRIEALNTEKAFLLTDNGFELDYMEVKYMCPKCRDTGILETGEKCLCFGEVTKTKIQMLTKQTTE